MHQNPERMTGYSPRSATPEPRDLTEVIEDRAERALDDPRSVTPEV